MKTFIFANGLIESVDWIRPKITPSTTLIAADGGTHHLYKLGILPHLVVGDGDSLTADVLAWLEAGNVPIQMHPADKDETDLELAIQAAIVRNPDDEIGIFGAFGGRVDQMLGNVLLLAHPAWCGKSITLYEEGQRAWLIADQSTIVGDSGDTVSLLPIGGDCHIERTTGLKWPLVDSVLAFGPARGISNVMVADSAEIVLKSGLLLACHLSEKQATEIHRGRFA